jgi:hypothetical protein
MEVIVIRKIRSVVDYSQPQLDAQVDFGSPPWRNGRANAITIHSTLVKGNSLKGGQTVLFVPPGIRLVGAPIWSIPENDALMPGYNAIGSKLWDYRALAPSEWTFDGLLKAA